MASDEGNPNEKKGYEKDLFNNFRREELKRCSQDPMYFIKNYVKIQDTNIGEVPFEVYPYQEHLIKGFHEHKNSIAMVGRQQGKCVWFNTLISKNGLKIKIGSLINLSFKEKLVSYIENIIMKLS